MIVKLPLVPFVITGVCTKVRFKSKVTSGFSVLAASRLDFASSQLSRGSRINVIWINVILATPT